MKYKLYLESNILHLQKVFNLAGVYDTANQGLITLYGTDTENCWACELWIHKCPLTYSATPLGNLAPQTFSIYKTVNLPNKLQRMKEAGFILDYYPDRIARE